MNALLQSTKVDILERQTFNNNCIFDNHILAAIEAYDVEGSTKEKATAFMKALTPLWKMYKKESYVPLFEEYIKMEIGLEALTQGHTAHVNHVIQEFLFGYNILMNCDYLQETYNFEDGKNKSDSDFGEVFFSWMAAALLHDVGYDIERAPEEEEFRERKNQFWDFMTKRSITQEPLIISSIGSGNKVINDIIIPEIKGIPGAPNLSISEFNNLFCLQVQNRKGWIKYDHGVISAIKYITELKKLEEKESQLDYLNWEPNRNAALAMAIHNFRYKNCDLQLSCNNTKTLIPYLLIVSDEIQEWEREKIDADLAIPEQFTSSGKTRKNTELIGIRFRNKNAYVIVNHKLKDPCFKDQFTDYLLEKIALQKEHYPIRVLFPQLNKEIRKQIFRATVALASNVASAGADALVPSIGNIIQSLIEVKTENYSDLRDSIRKYGKLRKIAETECSKNLLNPNSPDSIYEIFVDHRIDGDPFLTVVFPL